MTQPVPSRPTENQTRPKLFQELEVHAGRLNSPEIAHEVWDEHLNDIERRSLGSLQEAYAQGRTIGMWARAKNVNIAVATVQLAGRFGLPDAKCRWLLEQIEGLPAGLLGNPCLLNWNRNSGRLTYNGELIRKVRNPEKATSIVQILDNFQEAGWTTRIEDPLPGTPGRASNPDRIHETVRSLNTGLTVIKFESDGTGQGFQFQFIGKQT